ncbi:Uncharacterised protein [Sphingobacterium daejeonense]|nr:Uncharacterised protein [Sphingobacterium daejeonense]
MSYVYCLMSILIQLKQIPYSQDFSRGKSFGVFYLDGSAEFVCSSFGGVHKVGV